MFWIYGGGLTLGSIFQGEYNGSVLASNDVVLVSANYRLGALGFLFGDDPTAPGNVGFYDQVMALKWVRLFAFSFTLTQYNQTSGIGGGRGYFWYTPLAEKFWKIPPPWKIKNYS